MPDKRLEEINIQPPGMPGGFFNFRFAIYDFRFISIVNPQLKNAASKLAR